jgi:putative peptidoglycan lipid II flippase
MLIAHVFGADSATDAFFVAFKIPNFLRRLFAEGAFSHAFVPALSNCKERSSKAELKIFIDKTAGTLSIYLLLLTVIGVITAPLLIMLLAPGFMWQGTQYELSVQLLQITFPYLFFVTMVAFSGGILNSHEQFAIPALTPAFLNLCMIAATLWLAPLMQEPIKALAWGVFAAGIVQLLFQFPALMRLGLMPRLRLGFDDSGVKRIINQMLPAIFSVSVTQINLLLDTLIASFLTAGSVSWLYYSDRLVEFPLGIMGIALATALLPMLSKSHASEDTAAFSNALDWGLRLVVLVGFPATIGLIILAEPMMSTLFQYNEFSVSDVHLSGLSLKAYSVGLLGFILIKVLVPGFTSRSDMKTPVRYGVYSMLVSLGLNLILVFPLAHAGLALATSLGAFFNAGLLLKKLHGDKIYRPATGWWIFFIRIALAGGTMTGILSYFVDVAWWSGWDSTMRALNLVKWIGIGLVTYAATLLLMGLRLRHLTSKTDPH